MVRTKSQTTRNMQLRSRAIQTPYADVSAPPPPAPPRRRKRLVLDCVELSSASTIRPNARTGAPPFIETEPNGNVSMDFSKVRNTTWFDRDRIRRQREAQQLTAQSSNPARQPVASTSQRQLTPDWDAREERIAELNRLSDKTPSKQQRRLSSSPSPSLSLSLPPVPSHNHEDDLPHVSSPVHGEDLTVDIEEDLPPSSPAHGEDLAEDLEVERGKGKTVTFVDDSDVVIDDFNDDGSSDNYSDGPRQQAKLLEQKKARRACQRKRNPDHVSKKTPNPSSNPAPAEKRPSKRGRKPKHHPVDHDVADDEDDDTTPLLDPILDPDSPEYEVDAEAYDTPGPLSKECRRELEEVAYEFETRLHEIAWKYQKPLSLLHQAAGYGFRSHRRDSTWNDYQAFRTKKDEEKQRPDESLQDFVS
ncbi:hypothetical protein VKT23_016699 [Stygiomarasmius scandens]|uniref:Uncharacterized protein n=1 Tax=Marasmiellus scandens TaxID=2682957 RepID=A0ABR1IXD1_9AGAR